MFSGSIRPFPIIYSGTGGLCGFSRTTGGGVFSCIEGEAAHEKKAAIQANPIQMGKCNFIMVIFLVIIFGL